MAGSTMSGLLVAPMMKTFFFDDIPSISVSTWLMTRSAAPPAHKIDKFVITVFLVKHQ